MSPQQDEQDEQEHEHSLSGWRCARATRHGRLSRSKSNNPVLLHYLLDCDRVNWPLVTPSCEEARFCHFSAWQLASTGGKARQKQSSATARLLYAMDQKVKAASGSLRRRLCRVDIRRRSDLLIGLAGLTASCWVPSPLVVSLEADVQRGERQAATKDGSKESRCCCL